MAKPIKIDHILANLTSDLRSAEHLVSRVRPLANINPAGPIRSLHTKHVSRVIELAFMGAVSEWEDFLEQTFVRYLTGAKTNSGFSQPLSVGRSKNIAHSYAIISQNSSFDPSKHYLRFSDPKWTLENAEFFFTGGGSFAALRPALARLKEANLIRNRIAHSSEKSKADFFVTAISYIAPVSGKLGQGYRAGQLLSTSATRHFGAGAASADYLQAFFDLFKDLGKKIVP